MSTTTTSRIEYLPRSRRRTLVAVALVGYPLAVAALAALKHTSLNRWLILAVFLLLLLPTLATLAISYRTPAGASTAAAPGSTSATWPSASRPTPCRTASWPSS
jgi:hypothetical protein